MKASFTLRRLAFPLFFLTATSIFASERPDFVKFKNGSAREGSVSGVSKGNILIQTSLNKGGKLEASFPITEIELLSMAPPPSLNDAKNFAASGKNDAALASLEETLKRFQGLPAEWLDLATFDLITLQLGAKKTAAAEAVLAAYKKNPFPQNDTIALVSAKLALEKNKPSEAKSLLAPLLEPQQKKQANTKAQNAKIGQALFTMGEILQSEGDDSRALECFLLASTIYSSDSLVTKKSETNAAALEKEKRVLVP